MVGDDHRAPDGLHLGSDLPLAGRRQKTQQDKEPAIKTGVETLERLTDIPGKQPCEQVKGRKKKNEAGGVVAPQNQGDDQILEKM